MVRPSLTVQETGTITNIMADYQFTFLNIPPSHSINSVANQVENLASEWAAGSRQFDQIISSPAYSADEILNILVDHLKAPSKVDQMWREYALDASPWETYIQVGRALQSLFDLPHGNYLMVIPQQIMKYALMLIFGGVPVQTPMEFPVVLNPLTYITLEFRSVEIKWHVREVVQPKTFYSPDASHHFSFIRHGESLGNLHHVFQGQKDYPLSDTGLQQAYDLAARLSQNGHNYQYIVSSPQSRALETAKIAAETLGLEVHADDFWKEINNGRLAGLTEEEMKQKQINRHDRYNPFLPVGETGESWWDLYLRSGQAILQLLKNPPGKYLVVAHGGILNAAMWSILGTAPQPGRLTPTFHFENTGSAHLSYNQGRQRWQFLSLSEKV